MKRRARIGQNGKCRGRWYDKRCVGAGVLDGPHDRRIWFFGIIFSGSGAGAKTILLRNERGNLTRTCGMQSRSHTEHSAPGGEGTGGSFRCFCLLLSLLTKVGRAGARNSPRADTPRALVPLRSTALVVRPYKKYTGQGDITPPCKSISHASLSGYTPAS